ncbi:MAG: DUF1570 domain-containing protein [Spirochaetaceae bacterium]|nr:MAG: DUF1570 domain-containing protein [Spirochaetaceae bacterium]
MLRDAPTVWFDTGAPEAYYGTSLEVTMKQMVSVIMLLLATTALGAQTQHEVVTNHYRVLSQVSREHAEQTAAKLEAMIPLYNRYFRFDLSTLPRPMTVRIFADRAGFHAYLLDTIGEDRDDFVYLHYSDPARSELIAYSMDSPQFEHALVHQNFIQFLRAFVANPPLWIREGFAVFFERSRFDPALETVVYRENLAWLDALKAILDGSAGVAPLPLGEMLTMDVETARRNLEVFYPQAWGMVSFLVNAESRDINRLLWDAINALSPTASLRDNIDRVHQRAFSWIDEAQMVESFLAYIDSRRSFPSLVEDGIDAYDLRDFAAAETAFITAVNIDPENHIPHYYLGLINYERGNHQLAEQYFREAMERDAPEALVFYAMGVNAFAAGRFADATRFFEETMGRDPERFADRINQLLDRMN